MTYSQPERAAELRICRKLAEKIMPDPCRHCIHRVDGWAKSACMAWRTFPACMDEATGPSFEPDHSTLHEEEAIHG